MTPSAVTIWRYPLPITDALTVRMPANARVLSVGPPRGPADVIDLWALVDPTATAEERRFRIVGTGNPTPPDCGEFIGTVASHGGALIWHVFEGPR